MRSAGIMTVLCPVMMESTSLSFAALASVSAISTPLPPLLLSRSGTNLPEKISPACIMRSDGKDHPRIAVGVTAPEVIEIDLLRAAADRHLVLEGAIGHVLSAIRLEHVRRDAALRAFRRQPLLHVGARVRLGDEFNRGGEVDVAADVVVMGVGVDDAHHRLRGDLLDLGDERLTPSRDLRIDDGDPVGADEDGRVAAASSEEEEIVLEFFDLNDLGACASGASLRPGSPGRCRSAVEMPHASRRLSVTTLRL